MSKNPPVFRQISAPLDVSDDDLNALGERLGVPVMQRPEPSPAPQTAEIRTGAANTASIAAQPSSPVATAASVRLPPKFGIGLQPAPRPTEKFTLELPCYVGDAVRRAGLEQRTTARTLVLLGLKAIGFEVHDEDLVPDRRRTRPKRTP